MNHEQFVQAIAEVAIAKLPSTEQAVLRDIKLVYGAGPDGTRGVTYFNRWTKPGATVPFVAVNALHQESTVQLAGTTIHELGHVLAGWKAGHGPDWHGACEKLGLRRILAAGTDYKWANFSPDIREAIAGLPVPQDGTPNAIVLPGGFVPKLKPCSAGVGTRGGKSRGTGSGSRLRLFCCACEPPVRVRVARDDFQAACLCCDSVFVRQ